MAHRQLGEQEIGQGHGLTDESFERSAAAASDIVIRICAVGQEEEFRILAIGEPGERILQRAPGGAAARLVAVETEHDRIGEAKEFLHMRGRRRRAQCRDRVFDAMLGEGDDVHVALDDDHLARCTDRLPCLE